MLYFLALSCSCLLTKINPNSVHIFHVIVQLDSMLPCICSVIDHRRLQNLVRTSVILSAMPYVPLFCSYHILMSSVICY